MTVGRKVVTTLGGLLLTLVFGLSLHAQETRWKALNTLAVKLYQQGKYAEAIPIAEEAVRVGEATLGHEHRHVATSLSNLALLYETQNRHAEAEPLILRALRIREKAGGPEDPLVAVSLNDLASLYESQGKYAEAELLYLRVLRIQEKARGPEHSDVARSLNNLASLYQRQGGYAEAEPLYLRALRIQEKALGPEHPAVALSLNNLGFLYQVQGKYREAEPLHERGLRIREKALGPEHPGVYLSLSNLGFVYHAQGKYAEAEPLYLRALRIQEKAGGPEHPIVALSLNNLASLYESQGKYAEAEPLYLRALRIQEKARGPEDPLVATSLVSLAALYKGQGKYAEAEPLYLRALRIEQNALGPEHPVVGMSVMYLAALYGAQGRYAEAEPLYLRGLRIQENALGPEHPSVGGVLMSVAVLYGAQGKYAEAEPLFDRSLLNLVRQFEYHFTYMSEKERLGFLETVANWFPAYFSFCLTYKDRDPSLIGKMLDVLLWQKGFIAQSIAALRTKIEASGDPAALELLDKLTAKKSQLAKLLTAEPRDRAQWQKDVAEREQEANELERELVKRSAALAEEKRLARVTWRDVQKALRPDEAAVEFVHFEFHDGKRWTEKSYYVALIVTPATTTAPTLVVLGEAEKLEGAPLTEYRKQVGRQRGATQEEAKAPGAATSGQSVYEAFWKPLEAALGQSKRVYLSPDGFLNQISFGVLPAGDNQLLMEKYDLRLVASTKDILRERRPSATNSAVLIGNPRFDLEEAQQRAVARNLRKSAEPTVLAAALGSGLRSRDQQRGALAPLPATKAELEAIRSLLEKQRWQVEVYGEENAVEEAIKRVKGPRVLHTATHGFFLADQKVEQRRVGSELPSGREDPMLRSGLFFAGAERVLAGAAAPDLDDGVLTAYEATGLNLQGTELVVLSACETGLGQVKSGEGVFGLRRALQVAGAEAVLMSLWAVPDRETQELMTLFYQKWLAGESKPEALRAAQLEMRGKVKERYGQDLPYFWGAFVLVGR